MSIGLVLEASGLAFFCCLLSRNKQKLAIERSATTLAVAAAFLTVLQHLLVPARLAGEFGGVLDGSLQSFYLGTDAGIANIVRLFGMLLILAGMTLRQRRLAIGGALLACISFALTGHTVTHGVRWMLAPLLLLHVGIVAFWFGSLRPLCRISDLQLASSALTLFSRVAVVAVPLLLVAGIGIALTFLPSFAALLTNYGFMIIAKLVGFALLIGLAAVNRSRLAPRIRSGDERALVMFRRIATIEWLLIWLIIVITVTVTSFYSPGS